MSNTPVATSPTDRIEKQVTLEAPRTRVWNALTDVTQFNKWFGVTLNSPFVVGGESSGPINIKNYEHMTMRIWIEAMQPETFFSYRWHPHAVERDHDYSNEPTTLCAFTLEEVDGGTLLTIVESGFDAIPESRRMAAFTGNSSGWKGQLENIRKYLAV